MSVRSLGFSVPSSPNQNAPRPANNPKKSSWGIGSWLENRACALGQIATGGFFFCLFGLKTIFSCFVGAATRDLTRTQESLTGAGTSLLVAANGLKRFFWYHSEKNASFGKDIVNLNIQAASEVFEQSVTNHDQYVFRSPAGLKTIAYRIVEQTTKEEDDAIAAERARLRGA